MLALLVTRALEQRTMPHGLEDAHQAIDVAPTAPYPRFLKEFKVPALERQAAAYARQRGAQTPDAELAAVAVAEQIDVASVVVDQG